MFLRDLLQPKGVMTSAELGKRLGISRQHAWLLWNGKTLPSLEMLRRLRDVFQLDPEDLAELERETPGKRRGPKKVPATRRGRRRPQDRELGD
jgi:transcriptional regulator with XRE-family HTH domain